VSATIKNTKTMTKHKMHDDASSWSMQKNVLHICSMIQICETVTKNTN